MSRWLIKYYPVYPVQRFMAYNLDILDIEDYCSIYYQNEVKIEYEEYLEGLAKLTGEHLKIIKPKQLSSNIIVYFNNKTMVITEADDIIEAISNFNKELSKR